MIGSIDFPAGGLYRRTSSGASFGFSSDGMQGTFVLDIEQDPVNPNYLYAATWGGGVFRSTDGGATWGENYRLDVPYVYDIESVDAGGGITVLYAGTFYSNYGVYRSTNRGGTWVEMSREYPSYISLDIKVVSGNPNNLVAATHVGIQTSIDGGVTWAGATGLDDGIVLSLCQWPGTTRFLAATYGGGLYYSTNSGASWFERNNGLSGYELFTYDVACSPTQAGRAYVGAYGMHTTTNYGSTWKTAGPGFPNDYGRAVHIGASTGHVVAGSNVSGVYILLADTTGRPTWWPINTGLGEYRIRSLKILEGGGAPPPAWSDIASLPTGVSRPAAAVAGDRLYVIGGESTGGVRLGKVQRYTPGSDTWTDALATMPTPVSNMCAGEINGVIAVPGGWTGAAGIADLQVYNPSNNTWAVYGSDPLPVNRYAAACAVYNGKLYVFGGSTSAARGLGQADEGEFGQAISLPPSDGNFPRGSDPVSIERAPRSGSLDGLGTTPLGSVVLGSPAYGFNLQSEEFYHFPDIDVPGAWNLVGSNPSTSNYAGDFAGTDFSQMYYIDQDTLSLYTINTTSGAASLVGACTPNPGQTWTGMAYDPNTGTMYGSATDGGTATLFTINLATGAATPVGTITGAPLHHRHRRQHSRADVWSRYQPRFPGLDQQEHRRGDGDRLYRL